MISDPDKVYPRSQVYNHVHKSAFATYHQEYQNPSSTSIQANNSMINGLRQRVLELEKEVQELSASIKEDQERDECQDSIMKDKVEQVQALRKSLSNQWHLNNQLQSQLNQVCSDYKDLQNKFTSMSDQFTRIKQELNKYEQQDQQRRSTMKKQEDSQQISLLLLKIDGYIHELGQKEHLIEVLEHKKQQLIDKVQQQQEKIQEMEQFVDHVRDIQEQNIELKKEIERVMEMGLTSQKQLQEKYLKEEYDMKQIIRNLKDQLSIEKEQKNQDQRKRSSTLINLENDNSYLQNQIKILTHQLGQREKSINQLTEQVQSLAHSKIQNTFQERETLLKSQHELQLSSLQEEIKQISAKYNEKNEEFLEAEEGKKKLMVEIVEVRQNFQLLRQQVQKTMEVKHKYAQQITSLKTQISDLQAEMGKSKDNIEQFEEISKKKEQQQIQKAKQKMNHLETMLQNEKIQKQRQNSKYRELLTDYKLMNQQLTEEVNTLKKENQKQNDELMSLLAELKHHKEVYSALTQKHEKVLTQYCDLESRLAQYEKKIEETHFLKVQNSSLRAQVQSLYKEKSELQSSLNNWKLDLQKEKVNSQRAMKRLQVQLSSKVEKQKSIIMQQYNKLMKERMNSEQKKIQKYKQKEQQWEQKIFHLQNIIKEKDQRIRQIEQDSNIVSPEKIRTHPDFKDLQNQYLNLEHSKMQLQLTYKKKTINYEDDIQKLKIQNQFHRKNIQQLHAQGYGITFDHHKFSEKIEKKSFHQSIQENEGWKNKYEEVTEKYSRLYQQYISYISQEGKLKTSFVLQDNIHKKQFQKLNEELSFLKECLDQQLYKLQLTPREPTSIIQRTIWFIRRVGEILLQSRQDLQLIRKQKKQINKESDKQKARIQLLEDQNQHLIIELATMVEKLKFFESISSKKSYSNYPHSSHPQTSSRNSYVQQVPPLQIRTQNDVFTHEASRIRDYRKKVLESLKKDIHDVLNEIDDGHT